MSVAMVRFLRPSALHALVTIIFILAFGVIPAGAQGVAPPGSFVIHDRYLFGPILARGQGQDVHVLFYRGESHYWRGQAGIGHAVSHDDGKTWSEQPDITAPSPDHYDRFASFGGSADGKRLLALFLRRTDPKGKPKLYQVVSEDGGRSWSQPAPSDIRPGDGDAPQTGWFFPFGRILIAPAGEWVVAAYSGDDNFVLVSSDGGRHWTSRRIIRSSAVNYSEMGIGFVNERTWIAVSRIDGAPNTMAQFVSQDSGRTWSLQGPLGIEQSAAHVAPTIDRLGGQGVLTLSYCDRRAKSCWMRQGRDQAVAGSPTAWEAHKTLFKGIIGFSGYQSLLPSRDGKALIAAISREDSKKNSDILVWRRPIDQ